MNNDAPIRVLQITGNMNRGGAETMIMNIYRELDREKIQFDFIYYSEEKADYDDEILSLGGNIIRISSPKKSGFLKYLKNLKQINRQYGLYRAIHSHMLFNSGIPLLCAKIIGIPIRICHAHSTSNSSNMNLRYKLYLNIMRKMINITSTEKLACGFKSGNYLYGNKFKKDGKTIPNAINEKEFLSVNHGKVIELRQNLIGINHEDTIIMGHVGSFKEVKNHKFMIGIANTMKKRNIRFKLVFVGQGPLLNQTKEIVNKKGLKNEVVFLGLREDIPILMNTFDVLLMPSLYEGLPVTLVESQSSRIAAVISDSISKEVDFDLGLIKRVSLKDSKDIWINELLQGVKKKNTVLKKDVIKQLGVHGYLVKDNLKMFMQLYKI